MTTAFTRRVFASVALGALLIAARGRPVFTQGMLLPSPWSTSDLGAVAIPGSASSNSGTFNVQGSGADIWGTADAFRFVSQPMTGDGSVTARITAQQNTFAWAKAGVMIRETQTLDSTYVATLMTPANGALFQQRAVAGGASKYAAAYGRTSMWLRVSRAGSLFTAASSADGVAWVTIGTATVNMAATVYAGLAVTSVNNAMLGAAAFDNVMVASSLPAPWNSQDLGAVGVAGTASLSNGSFTVRASGADIWTSADAFRFVWQPLSGDGSITTRIGSQMNTGDWAKAGVMIRETLSPGSSYAALLMTPVNGVVFQQRLASGAWSIYTQAAASSPQWLRLTRSAALVTAAISSDGATWTTVGSTTISMGATVDAGLAVTSTANDVLGGAAFDNVAVLAVAPPATVQPPGSATGQDIGAVGPAGSTTSSGGVYTVNGSGADIWGAADAFQFASQTLSGDGSITARVASQQNTSGWAKAGVMIRETLSAGSAYAAVLVTPSNNVVTQQRVNGSPVSTYSAAGATAPLWLRVTRGGNQFTAATSNDGATWSTIGSSTVPMGASAHAGLAVTSGNNSVLGRATFDNVAIAAAVTPVTEPPPGGVTGQDIGAVGPAGSTTSSGGAYTVRGSGADIWGAADAFQFASQTLNGDGSITARVASQQNTSGWAKAGVMIRETLSAGSAYAAVLLTPSNNVVTQQRVNGSPVTTYSAASGTAPLWLRVTRVGNQFTAATSNDGTTWSTIGSTTVPMGASVYAGLAVTSGNNTVLGGATVDNVSVAAASPATPPTPPPPVPQPSTGNDGRAVLTEADFSAPAAFQVPNSITQYAPSTVGGANSGLTVRYINGARYFVILLQNGNVIEFPDPGFSTIGSFYPQVPASNVTTYQTPFGYLHDATGRCGVDDGESCSLHGIFWDERDGRLYASYGDSYGPNAQSAMPSLIAVTLNHSMRTSSLVGYWTVGSTGYKSAQTGIARLPDAWAIAHAGGQTLIAGWGGNYSLAYWGGVSMGIAAQAFNPPPPSSGGSVPAQSLVRYPFGDCSASASPRMNRPALSPALDQHFDNCSNTVTTWGDNFTGCVFVDTSVKNGLVCTAELAKGLTSYAHSTEVGVGVEHRWFVFNPDDLASGNPTGLQPFTSFERRFPDENYSAFPYAVLPTPISAVSALDGVLTFTAPHHGLVAGKMQYVQVNGVGAAEYNGTFSVFVQDANTLQACAAGGAGDVPPAGVSGCAVAAVSPTASVAGAAVTRLWADTTGFNQQMTISYDDKTQEVFVLMSLPVNYPWTNTFTIYQFRVQ